jgi:hypothetical protein
MKSAEQKVVERNNLADLHPAMSNRALDSMTARKSQLNL